MSVREVGYRIQTKLHNEWERLRGSTTIVIPLPDLASVGNGLGAPRLDFGVDPYTDDADALIAGRLDIFDLKDHDFSVAPNWNMDPASGTVAPLSFGKTLNHRDPALVGDIKYLWEPNRHLHLVTLAQAYSLTRDARYLDALSLQLGSWFEQCPYPLGPNWNSSLEVGIRLINWSLVWTLVGGRDSELFNGEAGQALLASWLTSIYQHAHFIRGHFSRYSSANNHLIGELAGLFVATTVWPCWPEFTHWRATAKSLLEEEAIKQNGADGVNREQAISYQQFVLDFLLIPALTARANGDEFSQPYWQRIERMLEYLASIMDVAGNVPMIGDADDGYVVRLSAEDGFCPYRSLLATGAVLFGRPEFKVKAGHLDDKTRWLLGSEADSQFARIDSAAAQLPVRRAFPEGGYYVLGCDFESEHEIRLIADAGPLGYLSIAAHGHADALAFTLSVGGREILVDPGTYAYHTQKQWRDYFRGTSAHNTVRVDGLDQSVSGGNFMWLAKAQARCEVWEPGATRDRFAAVHDGYRRLADPLTHRREIVLDKTTREILITDSLECAGEHSCEFFWHFAEECALALDGEFVTIDCGGKTIRMNIDSNIKEISIIKGDADRPLGWVSRRYDVKVPSSTLVGSVRVAGTQAFVTRIQCTEWS
jgi:hypothetical protein